jgi:hypothetical protein
MIALFNKAIDVINAATPGAIKIAGHTIVPGIPNIPHVGSYRRWRRAVVAFGGGNPSQVTPITAPNGGVPRAPRSLARTASVGASGGMGGRTLARASLRLHGRRSDRSRVLRQPDRLRAVL